MKLLTGLAICGALFTVGGAWGADVPSLEHGRQLFASEKLGTSGKSCASCHQDGKRLNVADNSSDEQLADTINACIAGPLKGQQLPSDSTDLKSLVLYLKNIASGGK
jgi:cytochrome c